MDIPGRDCPELLRKIRGYLYIGAAIILLIIYLWRQ
jgi:hypothetical protein